MGMSKTSGYKEVYELAGKLYHDGHLKETNDEIHNAIYAAFKAHDERLCQERREALAAGLDSEAAWECVTNEMTP